MVIKKKGRDFVTYEVKATEDGIISEINKEISCWNGLALEIKIKRLHDK